MKKLKKINYKEKFFVAGSKGMVGSAVCRILKKNGYGNKEFGGENIMIPLETICKNDKSFWDTKLILLYIDNQLVRIQLYRPLMDDRNLMDFAMKKYGQFNLPEGLPKKEWRGNYLWVKNTETIEYISANIHDGHAEYLEIVVKLYEDKMAIYNEEIGKWLDTRE